MTGAFEYRPKYVDIRVKRPARAAEQPVAGERACDHVGCAEAGRHKAPKGRENEGFWFFCQNHAAEYNRRWNYFAGMSADDVDAYLKSEETGHRPTWTFQAARNDRLAAAMRAFSAGKASRDPLGAPGGDGRPRRPEPRRPALSRLQTLAFEVLALEPGCGSERIRARYAELIKRYHPDSNGGDRSCEGLLEKTVKAYQVLKAGGHV
jgi:hypothetical protein